MGRLWHAQEYEGMHCCCAWLRMSRFPFPCCTGDGKRSRAVDVSEFKGEANCEGGFGGKQVQVLVDWFQFQSLFFVFFLVRLQITFLCILGAIWGALGSLLGSILGVPGNSENWSPSHTKTILLQIWRGPVWYLLAIFFEGYFWEAFFRVFLWIQWHFGGPLGCLFGDNFRVFFWFVHIGCPEGVLGRQKWPFWVPFGGLGPRFGSLFARFWSLLEYHQINTNI